MQPLHREACSPETRRRSTAPVAPSSYVPLCRGCTSPLADVYSFEVMDLGVPVKYPLILGFVIVAVDLVVWRGRLPAHDLARLFIRLALFFALSWILFTSGLSPFTQAPDYGAVELHWLGQILEIIWWLMGARLLSLSLDTLLL